ncbi:MAG: L,D-transpeptidase family protein [Acidobacteria bacterium]|nr:L,D-transpeptidase family protein [Acidobacteriota bacterium]
MKTRRGFMTGGERASAACFAAFAFLIALSFAGCQPTTTTTNTATTNANAANVNATNMNAANANATNSNVANAAASVPDTQPVTLAVLDALFADESFARDLKSKLSLTDEQIAQLRRVAQEERAGLREANASEGTTQGATARATEKIRGVVGADKADQVLSFARERWASGGAEGGSSTAMTATTDHPNAVPTDTRVVINAPAFRMDVFEQGRLVKSYKVGIGYPEFPLPAGMRKASQIIFNPEWTPPDEPWVEAGKSKVKVGEKVPAGSKLNPLGPLKIPIGLPSLIHGGKSPARLGEFASHGCVGLTDSLVEDFALELAQLSGTQLTAEDEQNYAKNKTETKAVKLAQPVAVELRYETIVATDDGVLHIYRDVYDRGTNTEQNLRRVLEAHGVSFDQLDEQTRARLLDALKQMARDALGNPAEGGGTAVMNSNAKGANKNDANKNDAAPNNNASGAHVTRNVKGQKGIAIPVPQLQGKGYPVPVGDAFKNDQQNQQQKAGGTKKGKRR